MDMEAVKKQIEKIDPKKYIFSNELKEVLRMLQDQELASDRSYKKYVLDIIEPYTRMSDTSKNFSSELLFISNMLTAFNDYLSGSSVGNTQKETLKTFVKQLIKRMVYISKYLSQSLSKFNNLYQGARTELGLGRVLMSVNDVINSINLMEKMRQTSVQLHIIGDTPMLRQSLSGNQNSFLQLSKKIQSDMAKLKQSK